MEDLQHHRVPPVLVIFFIIFIQPSFALLSFFFPNVISEHQLKYALLYIMPRYTLTGMHVYLIF